MAKNSNHYDVIVIGAGPAGYVAAIRCAQLGLKTLCIDDWEGKNGSASLGGACVNAGCIPSKALLESSEIYADVNNGLKDRGIKVKGIELDVSAMIRHKDRIVSQFTENIAALFKHNEVDTLHGRGKLLAGKCVEVTPKGSKKPKRVTADGIILAAGSSPAEISTAPVDGEFIVDSTGALNWKSVPKKLGIIGAGIVGVELGSIWRRLGSKVTLLEAQNEFLMMADRQIAQEALGEYQSQGLDIRLDCRVTSVKKADNNVTVNYEDNQGSHKLALDRLIVAAGRRPNSDSLFAPETDLLLDEDGYIHIDEECMTNLPGVYAIGDLCQGPMLAHKGIEEAILVAETIAGIETTQVDYGSIPNVIYTEPEIAWVGQSEQALRASGEELNIGVFPFSANSRALAMEKPAGLVKIIASADDDRILGVHIMGASASELIAEAVMAMEFSASAEDLARTVHAYPTLSESLHEAALAIDGRSLHRPN